MNKKLLLILTILFSISLLASASALDVDLLRLELKIKETNSEASGSSSTVFCDTLELMLNYPTEAFCGNLSLELKFLAFQDQTIEYEITQISLAPNSRTWYQRISSSLDSPYIIDSILLKNNSVYKIMYTPLGITKREPTCGFYHHNSEDFFSDPSGNYDIYFVSNALGDIHWNKIRDFLELEIDKFFNIFQFTQPGKINYYLYPCQSDYYSNYCNGSFGIQPAKNAIYHEYSHRTAGLPASAVNLLKLYRYWGYAPHVLAEGLANLPEFFNFYVREYKNTEGLYSLQDLLTSLNYDNLPDDFKKQMQAASLTGYLISIYGKDKLRTLYSNCTDLSLKADLETLTGKTISELDKDWNMYVDTVSYKIGLHHFYAQREMSQRNVNEAIFLYEKGIEYGEKDSIFYTPLFSAYFIKGDYQNAVSILRNMKKFYKLDRYCIPLANMNFSAGQIDSALHYYKIAETNKLDPELVSYKLGQLYYSLENRVESRKYFDYLMDNSESVPLRIDAHLYLGRMFLEEGLLDSADTHFTLALNGCKRLLARYPDNSLYSIRAGEATLYLKEYKAAVQYLEYAEYVEFRPFYQGRILLARGMIYDLTGDRENAKSYYQRTLDINAPFLDKSLAQSYLEKPFKF